MDTSSVTESVTSAINSLYSSFIDSFNGDSFTVLDELTFINTDIMDNSYFKDILETGSYNIIYIVNSLLLAFLIYYGISFLFSHFSGNRVENPVQFIIKFTICAICVNYSYFICEETVNIFSLITDAIREISSSVFSDSASFTLLHTQMGTVFLQESFFKLSTFSFDSILYLFITIGFFNLLFTYSYRYILLKILILLSPFFILTSALSSTKWLFKMWLKNFLSLLSVQIVVSLLLVIIISIKYSFNDNTIKILYVGSLYALMKATSFVKDFSSGFTTDVSSSLSSIKSIFS